MRRAALIGEPPKPVKDRPKCRYCGKRLRPKFDTLTWGNVMTGERHTKTFTGHYGSYGDDRFCGLNCGYYFARKYT